MYINVYITKNIFFNDIHAFFFFFFLPATLVKICTGGIRETCNQLGMALLDCLMLYCDLQSPASVNLDRPSDTLIESEGELNILKGCIRIITNRGIVILIRWKPLSNEI